MGFRYRLEIIFAILLALELYAGSLGWLLMQLLLLFPMVATGGILAVRWMRFLLKPLLWRLRNRLIVAYLFISIIPIVVILGLSGYAAKQMGGQVAVYLITAALDYRVEQLDQAAVRLARTPSANREQAAESLRDELKERFPSLHAVIEEEGRASSPEAPPAAWLAGRGIVAKDNLLHIWSRVIDGKIRVTLWAPLSRHWLAGLAPGLGPISILHFAEAGQRRRDLRLQELGDDPPLTAPDPENRFDLEILWAGNIPLALWEAPNQSETALIGVRSRLSSLLRYLVPARSIADVRLFLIFWMVALALVEAASIYIGFTVTRDITAAVHDLYEGTERVNQGDYSYRIPVHGDDQIAQLSGSFNQMTQNVEHSLRVAKENERLQAELAFARTVQEQLFPKSVPHLKTLQLTAVCRPARMVSGDYYDYQLMSDGRALIALGDVAGKGIPAALLMASLQACVRMQVASDTNNLCLSEMMSRLNHQLHASTSAEKFATFFLALYDDATGEFRYTNAGHLPPLLVRGTQTKALDVNGIVVGAFPRAAYTESRLHLEPGDLLVAYTDGVTEPENEFGEMFGDERLAEFLSHGSGLASETLIGSLMESVDRFTGSGELQDDMTVLVARRV